MMLTSRQERALRRVLAALHVRDEERGLLPAVDRGPPRGLLTAACEAMRTRGPLPMLHQFPPSVAHAARAAWLVADPQAGAAELDGWLRRNLRAALDPVDPSLEDELPVAECRTYEDLRNRLLVQLDAMSTVHLGEVFTELASLEVGALS